METQTKRDVQSEENRNKRPAAIEEWTTNKKRALSSNSGSPIASNGVESRALENAVQVDEPENEDELERFQKAAIFRRMRYYQRELDRAQERVKQLEASLTQSNLEYAETEACWSTTIDAARRATNLSRLLSEIPSNNRTVENIFPSRAFSSEDFKKARINTEEKIHVSKQIIKAFDAIAGSVDRPGYDALFLECSELQRTNSFLIAENEKVYNLLKTAEKNQDSYLLDLQSAQAKIDRLESRVLNPELNPVSEKLTKLNGDDVKKEVANVNLAVKKEEISSASASPSPPMNGSIVNDDFLEDWKTKVEVRDKEILKLEKENAFLRDRVVMATSEISILSEEVISKTPAYKVLLEHASNLEAKLADGAVELNQIREELLLLQESRTSWQETVIANATAECNELKTMLKKRDDDVNRLRQQRDQLDAQVKELKATHENKRSSIDSYKVLSDTRGERISVLSSEVQRLQARLAAANGDENLLSFVLNNPDLESNYVNDLKKNLEDTQKEVSSLKRVFQHAENDMIQVSSICRELDDAKRKLALYESSEDNGLVKLLDVKIEELRIMKLKESQSVQETNSLYSEIDRLSVAWETLEQQVKSQSTVIEKWEEEKERLIAAKARSDNKYYKAMSDQDAKEGERKQALRNVDKQTKLVENLLKTEKTMQTMLESYEKEVAILKREVASLQQHVDRLESDRSRNKIQLEETSKRNEELYEQMQIRNQDFTENNLAMVKLRDEVNKTRREAEKASEKAKFLTIPSGSASEKERELQKRYEDCLKVLKCSICNNNMRSTVITKCMHSFCKACVDARISHRQRKCPACNLAFSQSDVQTLYFQ